MQSRSGNKKSKGRQQKGQDSSFRLKIGSFFSRSSRRSRRTFFPRKIVYGGLGIFLIAFSGVAWFYEYPERTGETFYTIFIDTSAKFGLKLKDILVEGRQHTDLQKILKAIELQFNDPIFKVSPYHISHNLKEISWVKEVHVQRQLPGTIYVRIIERIPIAIWQHQKNHYLVDGEGRVITNENLSTFVGLPIIVGSNAPLHIPKILTVLEKYPEVRYKISALVWIGDRRWDIQLNGHVTIKLPEAKPDEAVAKLELLLKEKRLDLEEIQMIDLRLPNKMVVNLSPQSEFRLKGKGHET